jgi:hypothetical protein
VLLDGSEVITKNRTDDIPFNPSDDFNTFMEPHTPRNHFLSTIRSASQPRDVPQGRSQPTLHGGNEDDDNDGKSPAIISKQPRLAIDLDRNSILVQDYISSTLLSIRAELTTVFDPQIWRKVINVETSNSDAPFPTLDIDLQNLINQIPQSWNSKGAESLNSAFEAVGKLTESRIDSDIRQYRETLKSAIIDIQIVIFIFALIIKSHAKTHWLKRLEPFKPSRMLKSNGMSEVKNEDQWERYRREKGREAWNKWGELLSKSSLLKEASR